MNSVLPSLSTICIYLVLYLNLHLEIYKTGDSDWLVNSLSSNIENEFA